MSAAKTAITAAALGTTAYARMLGKKMDEAGDVPTEEGTQPTFGTPPEVAEAQKQLSVLQWAIPALTGALLIMNSRMGEQQRPMSVASGIVKRLQPTKKKKK